MRVGVVGASGYVGAELLRILSGHGKVEVTYVTAHTYAGERVDRLYPHLQYYANMSFGEFRAEEALERAEFHFVALPHGKAMEVVPSLVEGGAKVVDLSADFRFSSAETYLSSYGVKHSAPDLLERAVYGLPEINAGKIRGASLVAGPGCYPTAVILALAPLARGGFLGDEPVIVDAKSGVSGAGRTLSLDYHFCQVHGSVRAYAVGGHRHVPEMEEVLGELAARKVKVVFTPHLVPVNRGILAACYLRVGKKVDPKEIEETYLEFYRDSRFVSLMPGGGYPDTADVAGSNNCHLAWHLDESRGFLLVLSAIDNLVKGASGQAVQCMNLMVGWPEHEGLEAQALFP